jgi:DNA invertase Pin-like site-specific DNA recombinase
MSTDKQETSPEQQRAEIEKYAANHGYSLLKWYADLGISGDRTEKRIQFQQMLADAADGRFKAILCWDQDRFGRFDSLESGYWIHPLRKQGVQLVTCTDGPVDWSSFAGRMLYGMKQEGKHQYLVDLSNNVTRRMQQMAREGKWVCGALPIGYALDEQGNIVLGPPEDVAFVQMLFREYRAGKTTRQLTQLAQQQGFVSSKGKPWSVVGITALLKKPMYVGTFTYGRHQFSKYQPRTQAGKHRPREQWVEIPNNHPAIVSQDEFDQVQAQLVERRRHTAPTGKGPGFALSGLLRCKCGASMHGDCYNQCNNYTCATYKQRPGTCERYAVKETEILPLLLEQLQGNLFAPTTLKRVRAELVRQLREPSVDTVDTSTRMLASVERKLEAAERRLLEVSKDMLPRIEQQIRQLEQQRQALLAQVSAEPTAPKHTATEVQGRVDAALAWFRNLQRIAKTGYDPRKVHRLLVQFIEGVELNMERKQIGKVPNRCRTEVTGGTIRFHFWRDANIAPPQLATLQSKELQGFLLHIRWGS